MKEFLWVEKYRPHKISEVILPHHLRTVFQWYVEQKQVPNLLLAGRSGIGKTTVAQAMLEELDCDYIKVNGSLEGRNIDTLRTTIQQFASSVSFKGGRKYVILDEADYLNATSTQPALRGFMEQYSKNCGFIFTCNYKNRIIDALHSRCSIIDFKISKKEAVEFAKQFFERTLEILNNEKIKYDKKVVAAYISRYYPDCRRILNELQGYAKSGQIDNGILSNWDSDSFQRLIESIKQKDFTSVRKWVAENGDNDSTLIFRKFYDEISALVKPESIPVLVLIIGRYQYQAAFVADQEINIAAFMVEVMSEVAFK